MSSPTRCPRFRQKCRANICPLDPEMLKRKHLKGEPICYYFRLIMKSGLNNALGRAAVSAENGVEGSVMDTRVYQTLSLIENPELRPDHPHLGNLRRELGRISRTGKGNECNV